MQNFADQTSYAITGVSVLADRLTSSFGGKALNYLLQFGPVAIAINELARLGKATVASEITATNRQSPRVAEQAAAKAAKARKVEIADRTKIVSLTKAQAANERLARTFDLDAIQLAAALQGKLSKEDEARVKALQALKTEDKNDDIRAIEELEAAKRAATFAEIARMKLVVEDSKKSNAEIIADARTRIAAIQSLISGLGTNAPFLGHLGLPSGGGGTNVNAGVGATNLPIDVSNVPGIGGGRDLIDEFNMEGTRSSAGPSSVTVNVNPTGSGFIGNVDDFERIVQTAVQSLNTAGNSLTRAGG
jgi:hypothetical protein